MTGAPHDPRRLSPQQRIMRYGESGDREMEDLRRYLAWEASQPPKPAWWRRVLLRLKRPAGGGQGGRQ